MNTIKERVLLIALLSEPNTVTGTQRTKGFVNSLHNSGYYPILISKNWSKENIIEDVKIEINDINTKYLINLNDSLSERINKQYKNRLPIIRKIYNFLDKLLISLDITALYEYRKILKQAEEILSENKDIKKAIVIADPFHLFYVGYKLNKKFGLKWVADYRDPWTLEEFHDEYEKNRAYRLRQALEIKKENKWVGTASALTSVSEYCTQSIAPLIKIKRLTVYNGFFESELFNFKGSNEKKDKLIILHNGTIYPNQKLEIFLEGYKRFIVNHPAARIEVLFIGAKGVHGTEERIDKYLKGYEDFYQISDRIPRDQIFALFKKASLMLMLSHGKALKGMASSKIYEYMLSEKPVLCCPSDEDVVARLLTESGQGFFAADAIETCVHLESFYTEFEKGNGLKTVYNEQAVMRYSRENQTKNMAALLDEI